MSGSLQWVSVCCSNVQSRVGGDDALQEDPHEHESERDAGTGDRVDWWIGAVTVPPGPGSLGVPAVARADAADEQSQLAAALNETRVSLAQGFAASGREGKPISGKYELEDGKLQLSVYTEKGGRFAEVIVDHKKGSISNNEPITHAEDVTAAQAQAAAMAKAKRSLQAVASEAARQNSGFRVVSVMPELKDGHPVAEVTLVKGGEWKTVAAKLD
jgi:uncharacterized membrane protein YkoI